MTGSRSNRTVQELLSSVAAPFRGGYLSDRPLLVGLAQPCAEPKTGIEMFGPLNTDAHPSKRLLRIGIVGPAAMVNDARRWLNELRHPIAQGRDKRVDPFLFPRFPGLRDGFGCDLRVTCTSTISGHDENKVLHADDRLVATRILSDVVVRRLTALAERDPRPDVVVVALSDKLRAATKSKPRHRSRRKPGRTQQTRHRPNPNQLSFFDRGESLDPEATDRATGYGRDFHALLKRAGVRLKIPTQLMWESSFNGGRFVQDDATRAWNQSAALYYKSGAMPWRVGSQTHETCYLGITFFRPAGSTSELATAVAQAFRDDGEGEVLRGEPFRWPARTSPRLSFDAARELTRRALRAYEDNRGRPPARLVVHKSSAFDDAEIDAILGSLPNQRSGADLVSLADTSLAVLRVGEEPPVRGTWIQIDRSVALLYTKGHLPLYRMYPGRRIPSPLLVNGAHLTSSLDDVLDEILALSRMHWNSADYASSTPITLRFARASGAVLAEAPQDAPVSASYRYFM